MISKNFKEVFDFSQCKHLRPPILVYVLIYHFSWEGFLCHWQTLKLSFFTHANSLDLIPSRGGVCWLYPYRMWYLFHFLTHKLTSLQMRIVPSVQLLTSFSLSLFLSLSLSLPISGKNKSPKSGKQVCQFLI